MAVWASLRFRHLKPWLQAVCPPAALGEPLQQILELALDQEKALHRVGPHVSTMFFDKTKCLDKIVLPIVSSLWTSLGGPSCVMNALTGFYSTLQRRFKINGCVGPCWQSTAPIQGCALSVTMIHLLMGVWCQRNTSLGLRPRAYFDDSPVSFTAGSAPDAQRAWAWTGRGRYQILCSGPSTMLYTVCENGDRRCS